MIDFAKETVIDVPNAASRFNVATDTIYRWMRRGLEFAKIGGKVVTSLEAIQRFSQQGSGSTGTVSIDAETASALQVLQNRFGIAAKPEATKDVRHKETVARSR